MEEESVSVTLQWYYNAEQDALRRMAAWRHRARRLRRWLIATAALAALLAAGLALCLLQ